MFVGAGWGADIKELELHCENDWLGRASFSAVCSSTQGSQYREEFCSSVLRNSAFSGVALAMSLLALVLGFCDVGKGRRCLSRVTEGLMYGASLLLAVTSLLVIQSPLFQPRTVQALTDGKAVEQRDLRVGSCVFRSPVVNPWPIFSTGLNNPLYCVFPGPSAILYFASVTFLCISGVLFSMGRIRATPEKLEGVTSIGFYQAPMSNSIANSLNLMAQQKKEYSLLDATRRHFKFKRGLYCSYAIPVLAILNAIMFLIWGFFGEQYLLLLKMDLTRFSAATNPEYPVLTKPDEEVAEVGWLNETLVHTVDALLELKKAEKKNLFTYKNTLSDFSPIITVITLWHDGSFFFPALIATSLGIFPFVRLVLWIWLYFVPTDESVRGRVLTVLEVLGKHTLGNVFLLAVVGIGQYFERDISLHIPFYGHVDLTMKQTFTTGFSTGGAVASCVGGLIVGTLFVRLHVIAKIYVQKAAHSVTAPLPRLERDTSRSVTPASSENEQPLLDRGSNQDYLIGEGIDTSPEDLAHSEHDAATVSAWIEKQREEIKQDRTPLWKRTFVPLAGKRHRYSRLGIVTALAGFALTAGLLGAAIFVDTFAFERKGFAGQVLTPKAMRYTKVSIADIAAEARAKSLNQDTLPISVVIYLFCMVAPVLHLLAMMVAFVYPMNIRWRRIWFRTIELLQTWSALEALMVALVVCWLDLNVVTEEMGSKSLPGVDAVSKWIGFESMYTVNMHFDGFYLILAYAIMEKIMGYVVVYQFAQLLSEDEGKLEALRNTADYGALSDISESPAIAMLGWRAGQTPLLADTLRVLSPAQRYVSLSLAPGTFYAGVPRIVWRLGTAIGLMVEVE